jgi:hypothetical protein
MNLQWHRFASNLPSIVPDCGIQFPQAIGCDAPSIERADLNGLTIVYLDAANSVFVSSLYAIYRVFRFIEPVSDLLILTK